jgi:hypothetical protein
MTQEKNKEYVVHKDVVYETVDNQLFTTYKRCLVQKKDPKPIWKGAKIPWDLWLQAVAWCQVTQEKFKSEALIYLFYNTSNPESPWQLWLVPQITNGMTVKADINHQNYKSERKLYPDLQFGSIHHHCNTGAFASGTDKDDEVDRDGFHFTIGNIGSNRHSTHFRFSLNKTVTEYPSEEWIECCPSLNMFPESVKAVAHKELVHTPLTKDQLSKYDFKAELGNISKPQFQKDHINRMQANNQRIGGWNQQWNQHNNHNNTYNQQIHQQNLGIIEHEPSEVDFAGVKNKLIHWNMRTVNDTVDAITEQESKHIILDINDHLEHFNVWQCLKKNVRSKINGNIFDEDTTISDWDLKCIKIALKKSNWNKKDICAYDKFEESIMETVLDAFCTILNSPDFVTNDENFIFMHKKKLISFSLMFVNTLLG